MYFNYYINYVDIVGYGYCLTISHFFNFNQSVPLVITGVMIDAIFTWNHVILTHNDSSLARAVVWAPATLFCFFQSALTSSALVTLEPLLAHHWYLRLLFSCWESSSSLGLPTFLLTGFYSSVTSLEMGFLTNNLCLFYSSVYHYVFIFCLFAVCLFDVI